MNKVALHHYIDIFQNYVLLDPHPKRISLEKEKVNTQYCDEAYKYRILDKAQEVLELTDWASASDKDICDAVIAAINYSSNLVNSHTRGLFVDEVNNNQNRYAAIFRNLYGEDNRDQDCFEDLCKSFGARYGLISYLFFIKDPNRYLPITPTVFDRHFPLIGIQYQTAFRCSWRNYMGFLQHIKEVQKEIQNTIDCEISFMDAHSFVWILETLQMIQIGFESSIKERNAYRSSREDKNINLKAPDYNGSPRKKEKRSKRNAAERYAGKQSISRAALKNAGYCCEVNPDHCTFIRKSDDTPYTEAHHLIPLMYSEEFEYSLDNVANIVSLCSKCHNQLHYGKKVKTLLDTLYHNRQERLNHAGIGIDYNKLLKYYQCKEED